MVHYRSQPTQSRRRRGRPSEMLCPGRRAGCCACAGGWFGLASQLQRVGYLQWRPNLTWSLEKGVAPRDPGRQHVFGCLRVLDRKVKRWRHPYVGIRFAMSYRRFVGVFIVDGGCLKLCLWWVFQDLVGLGFWWVRLYSAGFRGL